MSGGASKATELFIKGGENDNEEERLDDERSEIIAFPR